jgi:hypothetical protein
MNSFKNYKLLGPGRAIEFPDIDAGLLLEALIDGVRTPAAGLKSLAAKVVRSNRGYQTLWIPSLPPAVILIDLPPHCPSRLANRALT